jgi:tetratricopeptide (TPR) repeat protein
MVRMPWKTYLWPGLPQLWYGGLWSGLALAVGFAVLLDGLLVASFVWVELLSPRYLRFAWLVAVGLWIGAASLSAWYGRGGGWRGAASTEAMFRGAFSEYLKQNWFEAERVLGQLLHHDPRDVESRLMLATLLRHTGRYHEALEHLAQLELLNDASRWAREINSEMRLIKTKLAQHPGPDGADSASAIVIPSPTPSPQAA